MRNVGCWAPPTRRPKDDATPADVARMLSAVLETTRADVNAAAFAQEAGEDRRITLGRTAVRLSEQHLGELTAGIDQLLAAAREHPDQDGVWTAVLWTAVDRQDRRIRTPRRRSARSPARRRPA